MVVMGIMKDRLESELREGFAYAYWRGFYFCGWRGPPVCF